MTDPGSGGRALRLYVDAKLRETNERVDGLATHVAEVRAILADLAGDDDRPPPAFHWPDLPPEVHAERWALLEAWVRDVLCARYPRAAKPLAECWADHPAAVDAVTACWLAWSAAYRNPDARRIDPAEWQRVHLPAMTGQVEMALADCGGHEPAPCPGCHAPRGGDEPCPRCEMLDPS